MSRESQQRLWFSNSVEGLLVRGIGTRLTPALREKVRDEGINLERLEPAYPVERFVAACRAVIPTLYPDKTEAEAFYELGCSFLRGYSETLLGAAMVRMMKLIGPRRTLERMTKNFRTGGNYLDTRFVALTRSSVELWISDVTEMPDFYRGMIEEGARMISVKGLRVASMPSEPPSALFHIEWVE